MTEVKDKLISRKRIDDASTYSEYRDLVDHLLSEDKTTGENHSEAMINYTKMNVHRMKRHDKRSELTGEMKSVLDEITENQIWLVLTEAWCGDAAQSVPLLNKMAEKSENIELKLILRDQNLDIMDQFLQRGKSRSIPKLIILDADSLEVLGDWGPRPEEAQVLYDNLRESEAVEYSEISERLHKWYADDKSQQIQKEIISLLKNFN